MTQQFLHNLDIFSVRFEKSRVGAPERVPRNTLVDAEFLNERFDVIAHNGLQPHRLSPALLSSPAAIRSENPIFRVMIWRLTMPSQKVLHGVFIDRDWLLRGFSLAAAHNLVHNRSVDINLQDLEID